MSSNSEWPQTPPTVPENAILPESSATPLKGPEALSENPAWNGWDVLRLALLAFVLMIAFLVFVTFISKRVLFPQLKFMTVMTFPLVNFVAQVCAYGVLLAVMFGTAIKGGTAGFWSAIRWNWPKRGLGALIATGVVTLIALQGLARLLPWPKKSPFDEFFKRPIDAYAIAFLAISLGPLLEELFFRGFLYPVLARRLGLIMGVFLTAVPFALIHFFEYGAWGPVLVIFLVGVVLTYVRARQNSVAASFIVHAVYNGIQMGLAFVATRGFQHLEKIAQ